jgi:hypothetical protein
MPDSLNPKRLGSGQNRAAPRRLSGLGHVGHRRLLLQQLIPALVAHPFERLTLISLARVSGVSLWVLRSAFGNVHNLLRAAAAQIVEDLLSNLDYPTAAEGVGVMEAITRYAGFLAQTFENERYRNLLVLIIRDSTAITSIKQDYRQRIVGKIIRNLEEAVLAAGRNHGITALMKEGACERFHRRLETAFALPALLPAVSELSADESKQVLADAIKELFEATFVFDWEGPRMTPDRSRLPASV